VKFAHNHEEEFSKVLIQFMIDNLGRIYEISQEELAENVDDNLAMAIFQSVSV
jgi:hypothetical protein